MRTVLMTSWLLALALASEGCSGCNDSNKAKPLADAPEQTDGPPIDAAPQPVTLTVLSNGKPQAGVHAYFLNPDSTVVAMRDTDATGVASALMPLGGSVTALDPFPPAIVATAAAVPTNNDLRTFVGVKPGDHLTLTQNAPPASLSFTLTVPLSAGANSYDVFTSCGNGTVSGAIGSGATNPAGTLALSGCGTTVDVLIVANGAEGVTGVLFKPAQTIVADMNLNLSDQTFTAATDRTFEYSNAPDATLSLAHWLVGAKGRFGPFSPFTGTVGATNTISEATIAGATSIVDTSLRTFITEHHVVDWGPLAAAYTLDMNGVLLPDYSQIAFDAAGHKLTWMPGATGAAPDVTLTTIALNRVGMRTWNWQVAAPYTAGAVTLPTLPTDVFNFNPLDTDTISVTNLVTAKLPGGYNTIRAGALNFDQTGDVTTLVAGAAGRVSVARFVPAPQARR